MHLYLSRSAKAFQPIVSTGRGSAEWQIADDMLIFERDQPYACLAGHSFGYCTMGSYYAVVLSTHVLTHVDCPRYYGTSNVREEDERVR